MIVAPRQVDKLGINAAAQNLRIAVLEFLVQFSECGDLGGQTNVKSFGQKKNSFHLPL